MNNKITTTTMLPGMFNDIFEQHFNIESSKPVVEIDDEEAYSSDDLDGCECNRCHKMFNSWDISNLEDRDEQFDEKRYCVLCLEYIEG